MTLSTFPLKYSPVCKQFRITGCSCNGHWCWSGRIFLSSHSSDYHSLPLQVWYNGHSHDLEFCKSAIHVFMCSLYVFIHRLKGRGTIHFVRNNKPLIKCLSTLRHYTSLILGYLSVSQTLFHLRRSTCNVYWFLGLDDRSIPSRQRDRCSTKPVMRPRQVNFVILSGWEETQIPQYMASVIRGTIAQITFEYIMCFQTASHGSYMFIRNINTYFHWYCSQTWFI